MSTLLVDGGPALLRHEIDARCEGDDAPQCAVTVRWTLPPSSTERKAQVYLFNAEVEGLAVDGVPLSHVFDDDPEAPLTTEGLGRLRMVLPPSAEPLVLELRATLELGYLGPMCMFSMPATPLGEQRHITQKRMWIDLALGIPFRDPERDPPPVTFEGEVEYSIDTPRTWRIEDWASERDGPRRVSTARSPELHVSGVSRRVVHGPVIGAGLWVRGKDKRPWLRGGWEVASIRFMVHTLSLESDLRRIVVVPTTEVGTGGWFLVPSFSAGLGVPLRISPEVRPGVRVFGGINFPIVSIVGGYDVFPAMRGAAIEHIGHVGLQFSL